MKIKLLRFLPLAVALIAQAAFAGDITIDVIPTLAPNADGSPSFPTWTTNALNALTSDATSSGTAGTPSFYQALSGPVDASQTIVPDLIRGWDRLTPLHLTIRKAATA
jgi:hypothetical protein